MISAITNKGTCYTSSFNSSRQEDWTLLTLFKPETKVNKIVSHKKYGLKCKFSPDSKFIVTTSADHTAKLWNTEDNAFIKVSNYIYSEYSPSAVSISAEIRLVRYEKFTTMRIFLKNSTLQWPVNFIPPYKNKLVRFCLPPKNLAREILTVYYYIWYTV